LTSHPGDNSAKLASRKRALGLAGSLLLLIVAGYSLMSRCELWSALPQGENPSMNQIGETLMGTAHGQYLLPFEAISVLLLACIIGGVVVARKNKN
ncbi:MAG: NADH-quinone oxidoreductase subunit J, partial [Muribaculaceae bacterium]|nr:NADH-quinone oxidoreductase subunit J [Muribaculaceae bacterium]